MRGLSGLLLLGLFLMCSILGAFSATIFDNLAGHGKKLGNLRKSLRPAIDKLKNDHSKRHISSFRRLDSEEKDILQKRMEDKTQRFNDDTSNERMIWRSHPQQLDFSGPDTASVAGLGFTNLE